MASSTPARVYVRCSLHDATEMGDLEGVQIALEGGADIEFRSKKVSKHLYIARLYMASLHSSVTS